MTTSQLNGQIQEAGITGASFYPLKWSEPYSLEQRLEADPPHTGVYRIWYEEQESALTYIGESSNTSSRLYNHEQTFGGDALFAYAERSDLDASHKRARD